MVLLQVLMFLVVCGTLTQSCADVDFASSSRELRTIRGQSLEVKPISLLEIKSITVQIETGESFVIEAGDKIFTGFTPAHLREHMIQGREVSVTFYEEGEHMILNDIVD